MYNCKRCGTLVTLEHRAHTCTIGNISLRVYYNPNVAKPNKQSTVAGYMKRFGSTKQ